MKEVPFEPADAAPTDATVFVCTLCGKRFTHGGQSCGACPLHTGCDLVSCPSCGHSFPRSSRIVAWMRRMWTRLGFVSDRHQENRPW